MAGPVNLMKRMDSSDSNSPIKRVKADTKGRGGQVDGDDQQASQDAQLYAGVDLKAEQALL